MESFINKLKPIIRKYKLSTNELNELEYHNHNKPSTDYFEECDWYEMPEYKLDDDYYKTLLIILHIQEGSELDSFLTDISKIVDEDIKNKTYAWYPKRPLKLSKMKNNMYVCPDSVKIKYPIYIISKGRYEKRMTSRYLEWCGIPYKIVVEPQEIEKYAEHIDRSKILELPAKYLNKNQGGIPARNFVLEHSKQNGDKRHWILDDNIDGYYRLNMNQRTLTKGAVVFRSIEDYVDRYTNIKMAGHNYAMFGMSLGLKPIIKNTRIYSSILLSNDIPTILGEGWRGRYNEDTDLSLRLLKKGYPTILFNDFLANKQATLHQKGGNTDSIYAEKDALYKKAKSLQEQHPDVAEVKKRFGRTHHWVDYTPFKELKPEYKKGVRAKLKRVFNNYGMRIVKLNKTGYKK